MVFLVQQYLHALIIMHTMGHITLEHPAVYLAHAYSYAEWTYLPVSASILEQALQGCVQTS